MINVIMPFYNRNNTLDRVLSSLQAQTAKKFILTIVVDGPIENEEQFNNIIDKYTFPIKVIKSPINRGPGAARLLGIQQSNCDYITFVDSDDLFMPFAIDFYASHVYRTHPDIFYTSFYEQIPTTMHLRNSKNGVFMHGAVYKTSFLQKYSDKLLDTIGHIRKNEDAVFNNFYSCCTESIEYDDTATYIWMNNKDSIVRGQSKSFLVEGFAQLIQGHAAVIKILKDMPKSNVIPYKLHNLITKDLINFYFLWCTILGDEDLIKDFSLEIDEAKISTRVFLHTIEWTLQQNDKDFMKDLAIDYWTLHPSRLYYKPLLPSFTLMDLYNKII